ncbi:60Kd inner membrane protein-domain-containing protein [Crassisporium funariophilum]|nr:60Kd inner membrane protein-domain-containing protein [Crassisporium funariophilum]
MALTSSVRLGFRHGSLRATSRSSVVAPFHLYCPNTRLFSSIFPPSGSSHRLTVLRVPTSTRTYFWNSSSSAPASSSPASHPVAEVAEPLEDKAVAAVDASTAADVPSVDISNAAENIPSDLTETILSNVPAVLQYGDLAALGLAGWTPAGMIRWSMELINVGTGLPWFWTIIAASAIWRLTCVPFAVKGLQASARLAPLQPQLMAIQEMMSKARKSGNPLEVQKAALTMSKFYKSNNVNPLSGMLSLIQLPITLGLFFGVQKLCKLPLEQLKDSGFALLPDLTASDPTMILPVILFAAINAQIQLGVRDINTQERPDMAHFMNVFRVMTIPGIFLMSSFPSGLLVSLLTTGLLTIGQSLVLRLPSVRNALHIPIVPVEARGRLPPLSSTLFRIKEYFAGDIKSKVDAARREAAERQRMNRPRR